MKSRQMELLAHSANDARRAHGLLDHLTSVAQTASVFGVKINAREIAYWAGLLHDIGKMNPVFQDYLRQCMAEPEKKHRGPDHSSAGAVLASESSTGLWDGMAFVLAGHHGGLPSATDLKARLAEKRDAPGVRDSISLARQVLPGLSLETDTSVTPPRHLVSPHTTELFLRLLFSALVDADFVDTEQHFDLDRAAARGQAFDLKKLFDVLVEKQATLSGLKHDPLNKARDEIYRACLQAAATERGIFRLTVPTGGGKTRSGMTFALKHAVEHDLDRVIFAIPYTSIIDQTAQVYRDIFGDEAVLEHHSSVSVTEDLDNAEGRELWVRLASENWDAPIVVTTTVQLFDSLFANRTSKCRKLHNVLRSVVVLDEVQTLPVGLLEPMLDVLQDLVDHYDVTVVLCTATQPALDDSPYLAGLKNVREIVPNPGRYFRELKRVDYELPGPNEPWSWDRVAEEMRCQTQCLAVVNTKRDALILLDALDDPEALHLSTLLCGAHRRDVLDEVKRRLKADEPCRLISTQVVEAGVDIDFPVVLRAMGPLDRIVQAAGRCNREGRLTDSGRVVIFNPEDVRIAPGERTALDQARVTLARADATDLHDPSLYEGYFRGLYQARNTDEKKVQACRDRLDFPETAKRFRMIEDDTAPVIVPHEPEQAGKLLAEIGRTGAVTRSLMRRLQPHVVGIYRNKIHGLVQRGLLSEVLPDIGVYQWRGRYDRIRGCMEEAEDPERLYM